MAIVRPSQFVMDRRGWQASGLVRWWPLIADVRDHASGRLGTRAGNAVFQRPGNVNISGSTAGQPRLLQCLGYDGTGDYVDGGPMPFLAPPFSLVSWFRITNDSTDEYQGLITRGGVFADNTNFAFCVRPPVKRITCYWRNGSTLYGTESSSDAWPIYSIGVATSPWVHAAAVVNAAFDLTLYVDGRVVGTDSGNAAPTDGGQNVRLGGASDGNAELIGQQSDSRIYRRALSAAEVWALYAPSTRWDLYRYSPGSGLSYAAIGGSGGRTTRNTRPYPLGLRLGIDRAVCR